MWKCKVPPKVRVFWWRVAHDYMPCRENLHQKHIDPMAICKACGIEDEMTYHALTQCTFAVEFSDKLRTLTSIKIPKLCPSTWTCDLLDNSICSEEDRGVIMCGMWSLWRCRKDRNHGKVPIQPGKALEWAIDTCSELANGFKVASRVEAAQVTC
jgi:hypothetical protein